MPRHLSYANVIARLAQFRRAAPTGYSTAATTAGERATLSPGRALVARDLTAQTQLDIPDGGGVIVEFVLDQPPLLAEGAEDQMLRCIINGVPGANDLGCQARASTNPGRVRWGISVEPAG